MVREEGLEPSFTIWPPACKTGALAKLSYSRIKMEQEMGIEPT